jgi:hypothetical protein
MANVASSSFSFPYRLAATAESGGGAKIDGKRTLWGKSGRICGVNDGEWKGKGRGLCREIREKEVPQIDANFMVVDRD